MTVVDDFVFWPAAVRLKPFREHIRAAVVGGFDSLGVSPWTCLDCERQGISMATMKRMAAEEGLAIRHFEGVADWSPIRLPALAPAELAGAFDYSLEQCFEMCSELGVTNIVTVGAYTPGSVPLDELVDGFRRCCTWAEKLGIRVEMEFLPFLAVNSLSCAWEIVRLADCENSGLMVDTWHLAHSGSTWHELAGIPGSKLQSLQLSDGYHEIKGGSLLYDTQFNRDFPGMGELEIVAVVEAMKEAGGLRSIGCEVFSERANQMTAEEAGRISGETSRDILEKTSLACRKPLPVESQAI